jgi:hypothetical protein
MWMTDIGVGVVGGKSSGVVLDAHFSVSSHLLKLDVTRQCNRTHPSFQSDLMQGLRMVKLLLFGTTILVLLVCHLVYDGQNDLDLAD